MADDSAGCHLSKASGCELSKFCQGIPKAELHAHLHGSIRPPTLRNFVETSLHLRDSAEAVSIIRDVLPSPKRSLRDCFRIFDLIHQVVTKPSAVERITREYLEDCFSDNISYVELRTTPRAITSHGDPEHLRWLSAFTPADIAHLEEAALVYCAVVMTTLARCQRDGCRVLPRLLLSLNRGLPSEIAAQTVAIAAFLRNNVVVLGTEVTMGLIQRADKEVPLGAKAYGPYVVGVDLSGDPTRGDIDEFLPVLSDARTAGLRVTIHAAEVMNVAETEKILAFSPDRLGHVCVLAPVSFSKLVERHREGSGIPIEICPTSNALTLHLTDISHHPTLTPWIFHGYPIVVCTDDQGVFGITLSEEYALVAQSHSLDRDEVCRLAMRGFEHTFSTDAEFARTRAQALEVLSSIISAAQSV